MKFIKFILILLITASFINSYAAQFNVLEKVKKKVNSTIEKNIDEQVNTTVDVTEKEIKEGKTKKTENKENGNAKKSSKIKSTYKKIENDENVKVWRKYDFVQGDKIIFADDLSSEQVGEFPSKWDLLYGNAETVLFDGENALGFMHKSTKVTPYMDKEDFLPEVFTIEFDFYYYAKYNEAYYINFDKYMPEIDIRPHKVSMKNFVGTPGDNAKNAGWHHFALSFNKGALKVYYDQTRVLNIPRLKDKPTTFSISALSHGAIKGDYAIIKNIRVAEGGVKLYDRVLSEGKFVTSGILFDSDRANIKPESMGVLNKIVKMMNEHKDLKFNIEGHTDGDGEEAHNQTLSEQRAKSVKSAIVNLGIDESRFTTNGFGESIPIDNNNTPEGKANNRRVEFVKS